VPSRYRRVGVVLDPELDDALRLTAPDLRASSQAARLRELALIGARSLRSQASETERARAALDELGATRERGDLLAIARRLRRPGAGDEAPTESLQWARGPR
jgi:hypothetical protein